MADQRDPELYVSLREYAELRWRDHESVHRAESALRTEALASLDHRLESMNTAIDQLRQVLTEVDHTTVARDLYDQRHRELDERIQEVERNMVRQEALDSTSAELARTRKALAYTIIGGVTITLIAAFVDVLIRLAH